MTVYVLVNHSYFESGYVLYGVYSSYEKAEEARNNTDGFHVNFQILEVDMDQPARYIP